MHEDNVTIYLMSADKNAREQQKESSIYNLFSISLQMAPILV